jgi:hypothetical protein
MHETFMIGCVIVCATHYYMTTSPSRHMIFTWHLQNHVDAKRGSPLLVLLGVIIVFLKHFKKSTIII